MEQTLSPPKRLLREIGDWEYNREFSHIQMYRKSSIKPPDAAYLFRVC